MPKKLIINADDFGLTSSITQGIIDGHRRGIITSASLMACAGAFDEACELAASNPDLDLGVHLTLDEERAVLPRNEIPGLLGPDGRFHSRTKVMWLLATGQMKLVEVEREWSAQIERCLVRVRTLSHLDSHGHVHAFPALAVVAEKLRANYGIPYLRKPRERMAISGHKASWRGYLKKTLVSSSTISALRRAHVAKQHTPTDFFGLAASGRLDVQTFWCLLNHVGEGISELMTHPGYADDYTIERYGHWRYHWEDELSALFEIAKARDRLMGMGIVLTCFEREKARAA